MPQLNETAAEKLPPEQAAELVRVLDRQAQWENHREDPAKSAGTFTDLQTRRKAFDAFQTAWRNYTAKYRDALLPEPTQNMADRLALWCRALRSVFRRAETGNALHVMEKVYRLADRIATRMGKEPATRTPVEDLALAVRELDVVIAWCEAIATTAVQPLKLAEEHAA